MNHQGAKVADGPPAFSRPVIGCRPNACGADWPPPTDPKDALVPWWFKISGFPFMPLVSPRPFIAGFVFAGRTCNSEIIQESSPATAGLMPDSETTASFADIERKFAS
ncbi:hypothetical protein [Telmatospirillum siberiense]|uniref:hypothetical protein n=1 Tax=Telmatospirillum siberiense TaxID=382514 RepID=UPI0011AEC911|nr:hypothetical protein [Telmatospirillum siberiense]